MRLIHLLAAAVACIPGLAPAAGDGTFLALVRLAIQNPVAAAAGDFNGDGVPDLAAVDGSTQVTVFLGDLRNRSAWIRQSALPAGGGWHILAADFDGDGADDLVTADPGTLAHFFRSKGNGAFAAPVALPQSSGARWMAAADLDGDGKRDLAVARYEANTVTVYWGSGDGTFTVRREYRMAGQPHVVEVGDYDGDGKLDLLAKLSSLGVQPLKGGGNRTFAARPVAANVGGDGPTAMGDFNNDDKTDIAVGCCGAGVSLGNGSFRKVVSFDSWGVPAIADINGDGNQDLILDSSGVLKIYLGNEDGSLLGPITAIGRAGANFLLATDLNGDGPADLVFLEAGGLSILWGSPGDGVTGVTLSRLREARAVAVADLDRDGAPDYFVPSGSKPTVSVYLKPGRRSFTSPSLVIDTQSIFTSLEALDVDGDGVPDLVGASRSGGTAGVALLDAAGRVRSETVYPAGLLPSAIAVDRIDGDATPDLAVACAGSGQVAVFLGRGGGAFGEALKVPTIAGPKDFALGDLDGDGRMDLAVISSGEVAIQFGSGDGTFSEPARLAPAASASYSGLAILDADADGITDVAALDANSGLYLLRGKGQGSFAPEAAVQTGKGPVVLSVADLDGDGLPDFATANGPSQSVSVLLSQGAQAVPARADYALGFAPLGLRVADVDGDGALDLVAFSGNFAVLLAGRRQTAKGRLFHRGDPDGDGAAGVSDAIALLSFLFFAGPASACAESADADNDGRIDVSDAVAVLLYLFLAGEPPAPPGPPPAACGTDPDPPGSPGDLGCGSYARC